MGDAIKKIEELIARHPNLGAYADDIYLIYNEGFSEGTKDMFDVIAPLTAKIDKLETENKMLKNSTEYFHPAGSVE